MAEKEITLLNDHKKTLSDVDNEEARKHIGHKVQKLPGRNIQSHKIPYLFCDVDTWICMDCKVRFKTHNWREVERRKKNIEKTYIEHKEDEQ